MRVFIRVLMFVVAISWASPLLAGSLDVGSAFSDPSVRVPMPDKWIKQPVDRGAVDLNVMLDQQMYRVLGPIVQRYAREHKLKIALSDGTCGHSAGALLKKKADIGAFCCPPRNADRLPGLRFYTIGISPIALLIHPDNPVENMSEDQVRKVFTGAISRWSQLKTVDGKAGPNKPIQQVARLHCKTRPGHWRLIVDHEDLFSTDLKEVGTIPDMMSVAATNVRAIGHVSAWLVSQAKKDVKSLKVNGISISNLDALVDGRYPFYKTFSVTTWEGDSVENPKAKALVKFILEQVELLDEKYFVVPPSKLRAAGWLFDGNELVGKGL
jgi:phosphate transport system substrate-binding protein